MMEAAPLRAPVRYRHLERVVGRFRGHPGGHGPTHDLARPHVHHNRQVQPALMGPDVMSTNRALSGPSALKSRFTGSGADSPSEARFSFSGSFVQRLGHAVPAVPPHYPGHALSRDALAVALQDLEDLRRAADATAGLVNFKYLRRELRVMSRRACSEAADLRCA